MYCGLNNIPTQIALQSSITEIDSDITSINSRLSSISSVANSKTKVINGSYTGNDTYPRNVVTSNGKFIIIIGVQTSGSADESVYSMANQGQAATYQRIGYSGNRLTIMSGHTGELLNMEAYIYYWYVFS